MNAWRLFPGDEPPADVEIEVVVLHCNPDLNLEPRRATGQMRDDGFYFTDGGELSWAWDIIRWRKLKEGE